jgi:hypothetical protein
MPPTLENQNVVIDSANMLAYKILIKVFDNGFSFRDYFCFNYISLVNFVVSLSREPPLPLK